MKNLVFVKRKLYLIKRILFLLKKELFVEYRENKTMFCAAALALSCSFVFSFMASLTDFSGNYNFIFWTAVFFTVFPGLDKIFRYEIERKNMKFLLQHYDVNEIAISKFIFNFLLIFVSEIIVLASCLYFNNLRLSSGGMFVILVLSSFAIASSTLFTALLSAKSGGNFIFAISMMPVIIPLMIILFKINIFEVNSINFKNAILVFLYGFFYLLVSLKFSGYIIKED